MQREEETHEKDLGQYPAGSNCSMNSNNDSCRSKGGCSRIIKAIKVGQQKLIRLKIQV